ncbi:TPA: hypothetical protein ACH354_002295 [Clostridium perfringens]
MFRKFKTLKTKLDEKTKDKIYEEIKNMYDENKCVVRIDYDILNNNFKVWYL